MFETLKKKVRGVLADAELTPQEQLVRQLDVLAELRRRVAALAKPYDEQIEALSLKRQSILQELPLEIEKLEQSCRELCVGIGQHVFGSELKAEFVSASDRVDTKALLGWAVDHPDVRQFIHRGEPSCRIKPVSERERKWLTVHCQN